jgi:hypothetical protein
MPNRHALPRGARAPRLARVAPSPLFAAAVAATRAAAVATAVLTTLAACGATPPPAGAAAPTSSCLPGERGYLNARLKGSIEAELAWRGDALQCEGGARPEGRGLRASFLGHSETTGHTLRFVFGLAAQPGAPLSRNVPAHLTVIAEGAQLAWTTQGDGQCMVESLVQERLPATTPAIGIAAGAGASGAAGSSVWRVAARGYCIDPAVTLDGAGRLYLDRFDFAGLARFEENELHESAQ